MNGWRSINSYVDRVQNRFIIVLEKCQMLAEIPSAIDAWKCRKLFAVDKLVSKVSNEFTWRSTIEFNAGNNNKPFAEVETIFMGNLESSEAKSGKWHWHVETLIVCH